MNYAKAIKIGRAARNLEQRELAKLSNLTPSYISLLEKGTRTPSAEAIQKIALALGVPAALLTLLASERRDLDGIKQETLNSLASEFLELLTRSEQN